MVRPEGPLHTSPVFKSSGFQQAGPFAEKHDTAF